MNKKNSVVERLRKIIPLETKLKVALRTQDLGNWHNGIYKGNAEMYLDTILKTIENHEREHGVDASASILTLHVVSESALNDDVELELRQRTQELPSKTTAGEKLYYEAGWREGAKHTKMLISHSR